MIFYSVYNHDRFQYWDRNIEIEPTSTGNANIKGKALGNTLEVSMQPIRLADICTVGVL